jgi:PAS domain-containing protein
MEAQKASLLVSSDEIAKLSADRSDLDNISYNNIKKNLTDFRSYDPSIRFVYILGYRPEIRTQFFYVDSEPVESLDYSPPGQLFSDTREIDIENYLKGEAYTDGPYQDSWGQWVSGYAPIKNTDGEVVALLGIDTATSVWDEQIRFVRITISLISILLAILVALIASFINKKQSSIEVLQKENKNLFHKGAKLKELQNMAQISRIVIYFPEEKLSFDDQFSKIFSVDEGNSVEKTEFLSRVHHDDQHKFIEAIEAIKNSDISYTWFDIRVAVKDSDFRSYHIYGNIERNDSMAPIRFSGIIQDITDIHT